MRIIIVLLCLMASTLAHAGELDKAYQKEFAYLVAEKKALQQRLVNLKKSQRKNLQKISTKIDSLQKVFLEKQNKTDRLNREVVDASRGVDFAENDNLLLDTTLIQAKESLQKLGKKIKEGISIDKRLASAFIMANDTVLKDGLVFTQAEGYFLENGEAVEGRVIHVGRVARYGVSEKGSGILAPAGNGKFKIWDKDELKIAEQIANNETPENIEIFLYDSVEKGIEKKDEKKFADDVRAGGMVGEVIIVLGVIGFLLVIVRAGILMSSGSNIHKISLKVNEKIANGDINGALKMCKKNADAASKVIAATLRNIKRDRDHIEDIISESILHESSLIDRFGSSILVIAAISPLLGLLGTVTGMISTFDIITEFGTGDPKMLSSGISEALLTTKFGLVVAIPLLLVGNLLSGWARQIKSDLEQAALHMINTHKK